MSWKAKSLICFGLSYVVFQSRAWKNQKGGLAFSPIFHRFSPFNCCVSVVLWLDKGDYPDNLQVVFCPDKSRSFESFMCLDLTKPK